MATPATVAARKRDAAPMAFSPQGLPVPPGTYGEWLTAVVAEFGADSAAAWKNDAPAGWTLDVWLARKRAKALERAG